MAQPVAALIVRVAADLAELKTNVGQIGQTLDGVQGFASRAGAALAGAFSVQQIAGAAKDVMDLTGRIGDLAEKAGISREAVQELDYAAKLSGTSFDSVSSALAKMANGLLEEKGGVVDAVKGLGLNIDAIRGMSPDLAFQSIATAIAAIPDPMQRSKAAMEVFGKSGADLLPLLLKDIGAFREEAQRTGVVMSNDLVLAGEALGDSWDRVQSRINALKAQALMPVLDVFMKMPEPIQTLAGAAIALSPALSGIGTAIMLSGGPVVALAALKTAFLALLPFIGPAALIVLGITAVWMAFKNWDAIKETVYGVYFVIKTYMVDKLNEVWGWVTQKIDTVKNAFKKLYTAVVGNSYIPEMVTGIAAEMKKLDGVMVQPVIKATGLASAGFSAMAGSAPAFSGRGGGSLSGGGATSISIGPGAFQMNYPIMNDRRAVEEMVRLLSDEIMVRARQGTRMPVGP